MESTRTPSTQVRRFTISKPAMLIASILLLALPMILLAVSGMTAL